MADRFKIGAGLRSLPAGLQPQTDRDLALPRFREVIGQKLGFALGTLRVHLGKHDRDLRVKLLLLAVQQARMGRILNHHMLEEVDRVRRLGPAHDQTGIFEVNQRGVELLLGQIRHGADDAV